MRMLFKKKGTKIKINFDSSSFPSYCGGKVLGNFVFTGNKEILQDLDTVAKEFEACVRATNTSDFPKGCGLYYEEYRYAGRGKEHLQTVPKACKIFFSDAVNGEAQDPEQISLYKLGMAMSDDVLVDKPTLNPNSGRMGVVFELYKTYPEEQVDYEDDEENDCCLEQECEEIW